jgi:twitching motility protein PilT
MELEALVSVARQRGASDLHVQPGQPMALRICGTLSFMGEAIPSRDTASMARKLLTAEQWQEFLERRSFDFSKTIEKVRCRINILHTAQGVGLAVRLLSTFEATIHRLNLHTDLLRLLDYQHGLILVSGPTGSGKSTTIAALIQEINQRESRHIVTIENPIEYQLKARRSLIRQREVGRDTPSFQQALIDAMREDPDVIVVGEMRHPETMRLTLNAAETGHLVISTLHSANNVEALQRIIAAFPAEIQSNVCAQLADCLVAGIGQRLCYRPDLQLRIPECEILIANQAVRAIIRQGFFSRLATAIETGGDDGMWTFDRYRRWLDRRSDWFFPDRDLTTYPDEKELDMSELSTLPNPSRSHVPLLSNRAASKTTSPHLSPASSQTSNLQAASNPSVHHESPDDAVIFLDPQEDNLEDIISDLKKRI